MKLTTEQATALLAADPFVIVQIIWNGITFEDDDYEKREFNTYLMATNINNEHCMDDLVKRLDEEVEQSIDDIRKGISLYLCQMKFAESYIEYSGRETDPFWEIVSHELISTEPHPLVETEEETQ